MSKDKTLAGERENMIPVQLDPSSEQSCAESGSSPVGTNMLDKLKQKVKEKPNSNKLWFRIGYKEAVEDVRKECCDRMFKLKEYYGEDAKDEPYYYELVRLAGEQKQ